MFFWGRTEFGIVGLNQERIFNKLATQHKICKIKRNGKNTSFVCSFLDAKKVKSKIMQDGLQVESEQSFGILPLLFSSVKNYGFLMALLSFVIFCFVSNQFVFQYEISGTSLIEKEDVESFLKTVSNKKSEIDCKSLEQKLMDKFDKISLVSCAVKGATLLVNIKEKLNPKSISGDFLPIVSDKNCKILSVDIVSGTPKIKPGDYVKVGDVLIEPYVVDSDGNVRNVEAKAKIEAIVYNDGFAEHFDSFVETYRTGKETVLREVKLFGLTIYSNNTKCDFESFETETNKNDLSKNMIFPFKIIETIFYETKQRIVESSFEECKEEYIEKARQKALEKCDDCDRIIEEYHTIKSADGVNIVYYYVTTKEEVGVYYDS